MHIKISLVTLVVVVVVVVLLNHVNCSIIQFNNTFIPNCQFESLPCNLLESSDYWVDNKLPSDGDDILIDFSTTAEAVYKDQLSLLSKSSNLIYFTMGNTSGSYSSLTLVGIGTDNSSSGIIINLILLDGVDLLVSKLNLSNSYLINIGSKKSNSIRVTDKLIVSNNSLINIRNSGSLQVDGILKIDESSSIAFYNSSTFIINGDSTFKSVPLFKDNSKFINSNQNDQGTVVFYNGIQSLSNASSILSSCKIYASSYFLGKVTINGVVDIINNNSSDAGCSGSNVNSLDKINLLFGNDIQIDQGRININSGTSLALGGKINNGTLLGSNMSDVLNLNGGTLEIINPNFTISNYSSSSTGGSFGSIYFIQSNKTLSNSMVGFNNSNINIGNMESTLFIINSTLNQLYEDSVQVSNYSIISANNVTVNSIQLHYTKLVIEEESTFSLLGSGDVYSFSSNIIDTMGNLVISNTNIKVPLINLIDKMESSFFLINSNVEGSITVTSDNTFYPYGKSSISSNLNVVNGGQVVFGDALNTQLLSIGGSLLFDSNSSLYYQDSGVGTSGLIDIDGNLTILGKLIINIKSWSNSKSKAAASSSSFSTDYALKLIKLSKYSKVNGTFNGGVSILINGIAQTPTSLKNNKIESYGIKVESGYVFLIISPKKLPKWYIHALVIGILCVIGLVAGLIYAIATINNTIKYYTLKRKEKYQNLNMPLLNSKAKDQPQPKLKEEEEEEEEEKEKIPLKNSKSNISTNNIIIKNDIQDMV